MNSSPSDLMSYCSCAKKNFKYKESVGDLFCMFTLYNREDFVFREPIGDAHMGTWDYKRPFSNIVLVMLFIFFLNTCG